VVEFYHRETLTLASRQLFIQATKANSHRGKAIVAFYFCESNFSMISGNSGVLQGKLTGGEK